MTVHDYIELHDPIGAAELGSRAVLGLHAENDCEMTMLVVRVRCLKATGQLIAA